LITTPTSLRSLSFDNNAIIGSINNGECKTVLENPNLNELQLTSPKEKLTQTGLTHLSRIVTSSLTSLWIEFGDALSVEEIFSSLPKLKELTIDISFLSRNLPSVEIQTFICSLVEIAATSFTLQRLDIHSYIKLTNAALETILTSLRKNYVLESLGRLINDQITDKIHSEVEKGHAPLFKEIYLHLQQNSRGRYFKEDRCTLFSLLQHSIFGIPQPTHTPLSFISQSRENDWDEENEKILRTPALKK
jgi:hypothetical protein